ncbi:MAG TPA: TetR/AcrR family transcriptional regulator [Limnochordia bacterium]
MGKDKQSAILRAAATVFAQRGFERATLDEIVQAAGTGKGTVYHHFGNKEQLFWAVIDHQEETLWEELGAIAARSDDPPRDRAQAMVETYMHFVAARRDLWRALAGASLPQREGASARQRFRERLQRVAAMLEAVLTGTADAAPENAKEWSDAALVAHSLIAAAQTFAMHWCSAEESRAIAARLVTLHLGPPSRSSREPAVQSS